MESILVEKATKNIGDILKISIEHKEPEKALVIYDTENELTCILTEAYRKALPHATFLDFEANAKETLLEAIDSLVPRDLVVLIQTGDFRLNEFRIRIHLFKKGLKVIDHQHLYRTDQESWETYINALAYDVAWYRGTGPKLKHVLETLDELRVEGGGATLIVKGGLEVPKLNTGDYTGLPNIGGTFPIGEIFTEAKYLTNVSGSIVVYAFAGINFMIDMHDPFRVDIKDGIVVSWGENAPQSFIDIVAQVQTNERAIIREIGFGLNRAITREHYLKDITAFERNLGMHFSLGEKHTVYKKQGITADKTRYHVDLFPLVDQVFADTTLFFRDGTYVV